MKRGQKMLVLAMAVFVATGLFFPGLLCAGDLEPTAPPGPTMKTLDEIFQVVTPLPTGFVLWANNPRFAVSDEGTPGDSSDDVVLDRATGLIWARNADIAGGTKTWQEAVDYCASLVWGRASGMPDWRLPSIGES